MSERRRKRAVRLPAGCLLVLLLGISLNVAAQDSPKSVVYAQILPRAIDGLLLDVNRDSQGGFVAVGERGDIMLSADGQSWHQAQSVPTRSTLTSVTHIGKQLWAAGHDSVILTSLDAGETWQLQYFDPDREQPIMDILFVDAQHGFAIGAYGLMLETFDAGSHWEDHKVSDDEWHLNALADLGNGRLMIAGEAGFSYRSEDMGKTWEVLTMPYQGSMFGILQSQDDCILEFGLRGHVQKSCDFGDQWEAVKSGTEATLIGGARVGDQTVLVGNSGVITRRTGDGPFSASTHPDGTDFSAVIGLGGDRLLLVGEDGVHYDPQPGTGEARP